MQLYDYYRSSCAYRVRIALHLKKIEYQTIKIDLTQNEQHSAAYHVYNPQELVPTLVFNDHSLTQSLAIIEYLEDVYPEPPLFPTDPLERAYVRSLALTIACDIHPLNNLRVLNTIRKDWRASPEQITQWYHHWLRAGLDAFEQQLARQRPTRFCCGDRLSLADICLIPQVYNAKRFEFPLTAYPYIQCVYDHCMQLPAFIKTSPEQCDVK